MQRTRDNRSRWYKTLKESYLAEGKAQWERRWEGWKGPHPKKLVAANQEASRTVHMMSQSPLLPSSSLS